MLYLGLDCSTQSLKAMLVESSRLITHEVTINFDAELGSVFPISGGITRRTYGLPEELQKPAIDSVRPQRA
jgi:sugar (pentulose or hexulose) kinase